MKIAERKPAYLSALAGLGLSWLVFVLVAALVWSTVGATGPVSVALVLIHVILSSVILGIAVPGVGGLILSLGLALRAAVVLIDIYTSMNLPILGEGSDAPHFLRAGIAIADDPSLAGNTYGGAYSVVLGYLFRLIGVDPLLAQYTNAVLGLGSIVLLGIAFQIVGVSSRIATVLIAVGALMPTVILHASALFRESIIMFFLSAALVCFLKGILEERWSWRFGSLGFVFAASVFHAGVLGLLAGMAAASVFVQRDEGRLTFGWRNLPALFPIAILAGGVLMLNPDLFLGKFQSMESADDLFQNTREGGSAYLLGLQIDNWFEFILFAPVRALYFVASPVPIDWRGGADVAAFVLDSSVYVGAIVFAAFKVRTMTDNRVLTVVLLIVVLCAVFAFGAGVSNSGTAMRHRGKMLLYFLLLIGLTWDGLKKSSGSRVRRRPVRSRTR